MDQRHQAFVDSLDASVQADLSQPLSVDIQGLLDSTAAPIMVDGDFMTPEQMDANHRAAGAESDAAIRKFFNKEVAQNSRRIDASIDKQLKGTSKNLG
ncbi:hypothetical protein [Massilia luteola]|uniref:hypothetical protein n=1 Tax=Massilia luteola TaxID=3081751 RepID=UPI002ACBF865|nr:hypothetical protein [Massilia sp. Gc5]